VIWFSSSRTRTSSPSNGAQSTQVAPADRLVAYDEMWRREESALWDWLEERTGLQGGFLVSKDGQKGKPSKASKIPTGKASSSSDKMTEREIDNAIKVTEERLRSLKEMIENGKIEAKAKVKGQDPAAQQEL
jgi:hypothetical protein